MQEINFKSKAEEMRAEDWARLTSKEKAFCLNYERLINKDDRLPLAVVMEMTVLYEKYPDVNILACIPSRQFHHEAR